MNGLNPWMSPQLPRCFSCTAEMARDLFVTERTFGDRRASDSGVWPRSAKDRLEPTARRHVNGRNRRNLVIAGRTGEGPFTLIREVFWNFESLLPTFRARIGFDCGTRSAGVAQG